MEKPTRQYASYDQTSSGGASNDNPGMTGSDVSGSRGTGDTGSDSGNEDEYDEGGTTSNVAEGESGVPGRGQDAGTLTGTDRDKTGPGETMATES